MSEAADALASGLAELELEVSAVQRDQLVQLAELSHSWGQRLNLTGHRTARTIVERLVLDAAALLAVLPQVESLADLGSGAGYPGLPLAILRPDLVITLVESRERRHHFQKAARRTLGIANATPLLGRAEDLPPVPHQAVIAQAMARPAKAFAWMLPWASPGGWLILPAGESTPSINPSADGSWTAEPVRYYQVPLGGPSRSVWLARTRQTDA